MANNDDVTKIGLELGSSFDGQGFNAATDAIGKLKNEVKNASAEIQNLGNVGQASAAPVVEAQQAVAQEVRKVGETAQQASSEVSAASKEAAAAASAAANAVAESTSAASQQAATSAAPVVEAQQAVAQEFRQVGDEATNAAKEVVQANDQAAASTEKLATKAGQAASAIGGVTKIQSSATDTTKNQAKNLNQLGESFEKGASSGRVISEVLRGNILALGQLAPAIRTIGVLLRANMIGALITLGAIAANFALPIIKGFRDAKKAAEDNSKSLDAAKSAAQAYNDTALDKIATELGKPKEAADLAAEAISKAAESAKQLGDRRLQNLKTDLDAISKSTTDTVAALQEAIRLSEAVADAQDKLAIARIETDTKLSEEEKINQKAYIAGEAAKRRGKNEVQIAQVVVDENKKGLSSTQKREEGAAGYLAQVEGRIAAFDNTLKTANSEILRIVTERNQKFREIDQSNLLEMEKQNAKQAASDKAQQEAAPFVARREMLTSEQGLAKRAALSAERDAALNAFDAAQQAAQDRAAALVTAEKSRDAIEERRKKVAPIEAQERVTRNQAEAKKAREEKAAQDRIDANAAERDLLSTDAQNVGARVGLKLKRDAGKLATGGVSPDVIEEATRKAQALAEGDTSAGETSDLTKALGPLLQAIEKMPGTYSAKQKADYAAIISIIRDLTVKLQKNEREIEGLKASRNRTQ